MLKFDIKGLEQAQQNMRLLKKDIGLKGARFAARKGANVIKEAAINNAKAIDDPKTAEEISKNIVARFSPRRFKQNGDVVFRIGVLGGSKLTKGKTNAAGGDTWYWRFIEFGASKIPAKPFMRPALESNSEKTIGVVSDQLNKWLDRTVKKMPKGE